MRKKYILLCCAFLLISSLVCAETYFEDFDDYQSGATIDGVQSWTCGQGDTDDAVTQSSVTSGGNGNALELTGAETTVAVSRSASYGSDSPCWIEFLVRPGIGGQATPVPSGKIAAVNFDQTGKIYASNGTSWTDTGKIFSSTEWYRIILKVDFSTHLYDIYIEPLNTPKVEFTADAQNLNFIDSSINSISQVGFEGAYSSSRTDDSYVDDLLIHFVSQLGVTTTAQTITAGQPSTPITVQLLDAYAVQQTAWRDITLELKSSSTGGSFSLKKSPWENVGQVVISEGGQSATFYYKDSKEGKPVITVSEYPDRGWDDAIQQQEVISGTTYFDISVTTPQTAGSYFNIIITAKDEYGEVDEFYDGEIQLLADYVNPGSGSMALTPENAAGFKNGVLQVSAMYADCGVIEITAVDTEDSARKGTSGEITFIPSSFSVSAATPQFINSAFSLTVSALNALGQITPNYQGPAGLKAVLVSPPDASTGTITPSALSASDFSAGTVVLSNAAYNYWGNIQIEAYDSVHSSQKGQSQEIQFKPSELLLEVIYPSEERDFFYVGENIQITVTAKDALEAAIPNYLGNINLDSTLDIGFPATYQFVMADAGEHTFNTSVSAAGEYSVSVEDKDSGLISDEVDIEVKEVILEVVSTTSPVGTGEVIIRLVDEDGNVISSESSLTVTVELTEENDDGTASSSATSVPVTFNNGIAKVLVSNSQSEIVIISPQSIYDFKIKTGTITFGRLTKTGIGTLMWREIKE